MKCKNCRVEEQRFKDLPFGKKQCPCCGTVYTKKQLDEMKGRDRD